MAKNEKVLRFRLSIDVGGTFTDVCAIDEVTSALRTAKVPSSVAIEESELRKVAGLESVSKLIPMLVKAQQDWEMSADWSRFPLVKVEEMVEVLPPLPELE